MRLPSAIIFLSAHYALHDAEDGVRVVRMYNGCGIALILIDAANYTVSECKDCACSQPC